MRNRALNLENQRKKNKSIENFKKKEKEKK